VIARWPQSRGYLTAMVIDAVGSGLWIPFALLFFTYGRGMKLAEAGSALTAGSLLSLLVGGLLTGAIVDRIGPFRSAALSSLIRVVAFPWYVVGHNFASVAVIAVAVSFADRLFWAAHGGMVSSVAPSEDARVGLFSLLSALRNIGLGVGALTASLGVWLEHGHGVFWTAIVLANAVTYAISGLLLWRLRYLDPTTEDAEESSTLRYRDVFAHRQFLVFVFAAFVLALASVGFDSILPVYLLSVGLPAWSPPIAYLLSCILIPAFAPVATILGRRQPGLRLLALAALSVAVAYLGLVAMSALTEVGGAVMLTAAVTLFSFSEAIFGATAVNVMLSYAPSGGAGRHSAVYQSAWGLATAIGPGLFSALFTLDRVLPWVFLVAVLCLAAAVFLTTSRSGTTHVAAHDEGARESA
jgi:MFS family permease